MKGLLGRKLGMTRIFDESGKVIPVTVIEAGPCYVTQKKTVESDGYSAIQIGFEETEQRKLTRPEWMRLKKVNLPPLRHLRELRMSDVSGYEVGQKLMVDLFKPGDKVDITGLSKGRGFAGVVKRHGFAGGPATHGQSDRHRAPGSIGSGTTPGRVYKGTRMAGHMGNHTSTVQNLQVVMVDPERNLLLVRGAVPGAKNGLVLIREAVKQ
ncbi:MAG: 50S ribosomal protein L3 [Anaerolineae bacterium]|nr:50S ribosomal protein L3 [Anaerolineae bacterium]